VTENPGFLIPEGYAQQILQQFVDEAHARDRAMFGPEEYQRKGHAETIVHTPEWVAEREQFARAFEAMVNDGIERGFLDHAHCYECGGELEVTKHTSETDWVYDETEAEHEARVAKLPQITLAFGRKIGGQT
jgi:hypothetical protein